MGAVLLCYCCMHSAAAAAGKCKCTAMQCKTHVHITHNIHQQLATLSRPYAQPNRQERPVTFPGTGYTLLNPPGKRIWRQPAQPIKKPRKTMPMQQLQKITLRDYTARLLISSVQTVHNCANFAQLQKTAHLPASSAHNPANRTSSRQLATPILNITAILLHLATCCFLV